MVTQRESADSNIDATSRLLRASAVTAIGSLAGALANVVFVFVTARALGAAGRGSLVAALTFVGLVSIVMVLGVGSAGRRLLVVAPTVSLRTYASVALLLSAGAFVVALVSSVLLAGTLRFGGSHYFLLGVAALTFNATLFLALSDALNAYGRTAMSSLTVAAGAITSTGTFLLSYVVHFRGVPAALTAALAGGAASNILCLALLRGVERPTVSVGSWHRLVRAGVKLAPFSLAQVVTMRADRLILAGFAGPAAAGIYSIAAALSEILRLASSAVGSRIVYQVSTAEFRASQIRRTLRYLWVFQVVASIVASLALPLVIAPILGSDYRDAASLFPLLAIGELFMTVFYLYSRALLGSGRFSSLSRGSAAGAATLVILDFALIPPFGSAGAAIASSIAYLALALSAWRSYSKSTPDSLGSQDGPVRAVR